MFIKYDVNKHGTLISKHRCDTCKTEFSVCPAIPQYKLNQWRNCLSPFCNSYDSNRDVDLLFIDNGVTDKLVITRKSSRANKNVN